MKKNYYVSNEVVRWVSNDRIPFDDKLQEFVANGEITEYQFHSSSIQREIEVKQQILEWKESQKNRKFTDEEKFEMDANFAPGTKMVNAFTGKTIYTTK